MGHPESQVLSPGTSRPRTLDQVKRRGIFITLEGIDGAGKSTQVHGLAKHLRKSGYRVCVTREPGGTPLGDEIRRILLRGRLSGGRRRAGSRPPDRAPRPLAELALMYAARAQHLEEVVRPALARGEIVVSDRFNDASMAYQGYGRGLGPELVRAFDRTVCGRTQPDLTLVLDLEPRVALERARGRETRLNSRGSRFEAEGVKFQERVRDAYLAIARKEPRRVRVIGADQPIAEIAREISSAVDAFLATRHARKASKSVKSS